MSTETQQPSAEQVETTQTQANDTTAQSPTLEDIAKKYNVEDQIKSFTAQPAQPSKPTVPQQQQFTPQPTAPDPITDPDGWRNYQATHNQQLYGTLNEVVQTVTEMRRAAEQERLNAEVNKAATRLADHAKIDPVYAELLLEKNYRENVVFKRIWDNRYANPKALEEAIGVLANDATKVFQVRTDPQLVENQRAAKVSQKAMASTQTNPQHETDKMSDAEFERWWHAQKLGM